MNATAALLNTKIEQRSAVVAVIGLGYVGLPMAIELGKAGFTVSGIDVSESKVKTIQSGESDVKDVPAFEVAGLCATGKLTATTDFAVTAAADVVIVCVPTPLSKTRDPDVSYIINSCEHVRDHLIRPAGYPRKHNLSRYDTGTRPPSYGRKRARGSHRAAV